jgi:hypothetical protein
MRAVRVLAAACTQTAPAGKWRAHTHARAGGPRARALGGTRMRARRRCASAVARARVWRRAGRARGSFLCGAAHAVHLAGAPTRVVFARARNAACACVCARRWMRDARVG